MVMVDVSVDDAIASVVFEKPGVLNALAPEDLPRLAEALRDAGTRDGVRVLVVRGAGGAFSAGDDLKAT
jgi:enoyl-CoA hydratase